VDRSRAHTKMARALLAALCITQAAAPFEHHDPDSIYPEFFFHAKKGASTRLTKENFNGWIKGEVDAGRTAMVRWIASEG